MQTSASSDVSCAGVVSTPTFCVSICSIAGQVLGGGETGAGDHVPGMIAIERSEFMIGAAIAPG